MNDRPFKIGAMPVKNQETSIEYKGKIYALASEGQMEYILNQAKEQMLFDAATSKKPLSPDELSAKLNEFADNCGYATLDYVLAKMTPAEREEWKVKYRFAPITRHKH